MAVAPRQSSAIERSKQSILAAIGPGSDLTLVSGRTGLGDELTAAGARALLADKPLRELDLQALTSAHGHTALLAGGGFSRSDHDAMPRALAIAALRFERVIVLPSSFDPSEDVVREALSRTRATVFAREPESHRQIESLCDARLAHDCVFFVDYSAYVRGGHGVLDAFGSWGEAAPEPPPGGLLEAIAEHDLVRTDRADVMIAAALMRKRVEYAPGSNHGLEAIAQHWLSDHAVFRIEEQSRPAIPATPALAPEAELTLRRLDAVALASPPRGPRAARSHAAQVTAVVVTRDRPRLAVRALDSLERSMVPVHMLVIDNNSAPAAERELAAACAGRANVEFKHSERNLGCGGGRCLGVSLAETEFVLFLDDDAELLPGALEHLYGELEQHPEAGAVTATVVHGSGSVIHSGGNMKCTPELAEFDLIGFRQPFAQSSLPPSGPAGWAPGTALLVRRSLLEAFPIEDAMAYFEDNEWCYRVELARPGGFRRSREALVLHQHGIGSAAFGRGFKARSVTVEWLAAHALFYGRHGVLMDMLLFELVPELRVEPGTRDLAGARLLLELVTAKGTDWVLMEWMNGQLGGLLRANRSL